MKKRFFALLLFAIAAYGQPAQQERVAIINTLDDRDSIGISELVFLTDRLRETAVNVLPKQRYGVMTTESIVAFLGSQERAAKECKAASCLAELGRKVSADYVAQARIGRFGENLTIKTELYSSKSGNLIGSFTGNSKDIFGLLTIIDDKAAALFKIMPGASGSRVVSPLVAGGISGLEKAGDYELNEEKRYLVNLSTEPPGAILSFDGVPASSCPRTPCKAELREGNVRIIAAMEQYETADTTISIMNKNQNIAIRLKSNFGILEIKPAYIDRIGEYEDWGLAINGRAYRSFENRFSPGNYDVKLSHKCYEAINFKAGINKGSREVFDMARYISLKKGGLVLSAERNGEPASEPVFVNGKQVGDTPFSDAVPLCGEIEIGENRETVYVTLKYNEKISHIHKSGLYGPALGLGGSYASEPEVKKGNASFWVALALDVLGAVFIYAGYEKNKEVDEAYDRYDVNMQSQYRYDNAWNDAESSRGSRNMYYGIGSLFLASGIGVHIWF
jgi:hypothetical protein